MQKFEENATYASAAVLLSERILRMKRGDIIGHAAIAAIAGHEKDSAGWRTILKRTRRILRDAGVVLVPVPGVGFQLPTLDEQVRYVSTTRLRKRIKQTRYERAELEHTPTVGLSIQAQLARAGALERTAKQAELMRQDRASLGALLTPDPANKTPIPPSRNGQKPAAVGQ
jgi:hypothetical protein